MKPIFDEREQMPSKFREKCPHCNKEVWIEGRRFMAMTRGSSVEPSMKLVKHEPEW